MEIAILLTTCNSSEFLEPLLRSVQSQTCKAWQLYVRDDGSEDDTPDILLRYAGSDRRIHVLDDGEKRGAMNGFMWLLQQVEADYYMFCDHDDVWKRNKIELTLDKMLEAPDVHDRPLVVHTDLEVVDRQLECLEDSFWHSQHVSEKEFNDKYYHLVYNNVTGCTMMINRRAKEVSLPLHPCAKMHDSWITASVLWNGGRVLAVHEQTVLYRQHGKNTIGMNELPGMASKVMRLKELVRKTNRQGEAARYLSGIGGWRFWLLKLYYMTLIYVRDYKAARKG